jgi:putative heme-binding domain-containing protein
LGVALLGLENDPDPQVQLQLACSLGYWDDPRAGAALGRLADRDAGDVFRTAAVMSSVNGKNLEPVLLAALARSGEGKDAPPGTVIENLLRLANAFGKTHAMVMLLTAVTTPEKGGFAPWQYAAVAGLLDTLDQRNSSLEQLAKKGGGEMKAALKKLTRLVATARAQATNGQIDPEKRAAGVRVLGHGIGDPKEDRKLLASLLVPQTPTTVQSAAVATLGRLRDPEVPALLLRGWKGYLPAQRAQVLDVLLRRNDWARATLDAVQRQQVLPAEIDAPRRQRLLESRTPDIRQRAAKLLAAGINPDRQKVIDSYRTVLNLQGNLERGQQLFAKHCAVCHRLGGVGNEVGPDLASLGDRSSPTLLIAVLDPNRAVEARYINYVATTKNGLTFTGVLTAETGTSITLAGPDGKAQVILRSDLDELVSSGRSAMPEGLEKDLQPQDLADLFAYIRSASPAPRRQALLERPPPRRAAEFISAVRTAGTSPVAR